jgi:hypothetical protein
MTEVTATTRFKPGSRYEELPELGAGVSLPAGYTPAYCRRRAKLAVLRADDRTHYLVFSLKTGASVQVDDTKQACTLMKQIAKGQFTLAV